VPLYLIDYKRNGKIIRAQVGATASNDGDVSGNHGQEDLWIMKLITTDK